jgi:hypothetical protein
MILLGNVDADGSVTGAGDARGVGAGRALMDALDRRYPAPDWWLAADAAALHSAEGIVLIRSRVLSDVVADHDEVERRH